MGIMPLLTDRQVVTDSPAAASQDALQHFSRLLTFETDCWDVHHALTHGHEGFTLLDVRGREAYAKGHIDGAINLPYGRITERNLTPFPEEMLFVVYCAGPHCNAADRSAIALAQLGRPVKKMIGGVTGWIDEGFPIVPSPPIDERPDSPSTS